MMATDALQPARAGNLVQFRMGYGLHLDLGTPDEFEVTIEQPLSVASATREWRGDPVSVESAAVLIPMLYSTVEHIAVGDRGDLSLVLGESRIRVEPHPDFEAWQARSRSGLLIVCLPGGGISIWMPGG